MESGKGVGPASQRFPQGSSGSANTNARPPEIIISGGVRPVLNYSIQTGEEFALEFMRERAMSKKPSVPITSGDQNVAPAYMDLKGMLGISHAGSESGSDVSMLATGGNQPLKQVEKTILSEMEKKGQYVSSRSVPRVSSGEGSSRGISHGYTSSESSDISSKKMKFLSSFGGKILPRPSDGKLRYVGGDTHIIRISRDISWQELMQKTMAIYNQPHTIKYQLPGEDLDALVSVSCDEDLQNMMEECSILEGGERSQKPRMFLFSSGDFDDTHFSLGSMEGDSEIQYVFAVNGMDVGAGKAPSGHGLASTSGSDLDQLLSFNVEADRANATRVATAPVVPATTLSMQMQASLSSNYDTHLHSYQDRDIHYEEGDHYVYTTSHPSDRFHNLDSRISIPMSVPSDYEYNSQCTHIRGTSGPMPIHDLPSLHQGMQEGLHSGIDSHDQEVSAKESKLAVDSSSQKKNEGENLRSLENAFTASMQQHDVSTSNYMQAEVPYVASAPEHLTSVPPIRHKHIEPAPVSSSADAVSAGQGSEFNEDECCSSGEAFTTGFSDYKADMTDLGYNDPPSRPFRVYQSEMIPREQAEFHNRLSKSDDSIGSQFLMLHSRPGVAQESIAEALDPSHEGNLVFQPEKSSLVMGPPLEDGLMQSEKYKELADQITQKSHCKPILAPEGSEIAKFPRQPIGGNEPLTGQAWHDLEVHAVSDQTDVMSCEQSRKTVRKTQTSELSHAPLASVDDKITINEARHVEKGPTIVEKNLVKSYFNEPTVDGAAIKQQGSPAVDTHTTDATDYSSAFHWTGSGTLAASQAEPSVPPPERRDIIMNNNDRFPPDLLSDIFSKARIPEDSSRLGPLCKDDAGLSLNMQNHQPQRWSFFRNLATGEFGRNDVSLMDQDHLGYASLLTKVEEGVSRPYPFAPLENEGVDLSYMESQIDFDGAMQQEASSITIDDTGILNPSFIPSQIAHPHVMDKGEGLQVENPFSKLGENLRANASEYEELKFEVEDVAGSAIDTSMGDFDLSNLQIIKNEDLEELRELGSGTFGTVYHGKWRGTDVAIKRIKKSCFTGRSSEQERLTLEFWREAEILSKLHHPNVLAFYGVVQDGPGGTLATVTEFMVNGSLRHVLLRKDKYLDRRKRLTIAMDAAFGMEYLHSKNIVHFDLKCDNLLVNLKDQSRPICKVGDFGLSKIKRNTLVSGGVRGTLPWMAPELLNGSSNKVSEKVDVFSFGIVMWEILTGEEPYANMHYGAIIGGIVNNTLRPPVPANCDPEWRRLMEQCWAPDPVQRPPFAQIASRLRAMSVASQTKPAK
ncbi:uncharacterized protein [Elaeis guineensis]|uniref:Uncharacterized protein LOC105046804 n=1 Tax=Elaeis guineensis var. tenera TaxID=51953 RepID=A0A6I9RIP3_ELAGV|nr:uncharacterized protein LOC105046804 [Elaeis guineensis]XP_010923839.1 uncharacterized protein LOC105046804 [Elaeis guineensis]